MLGCYMPWQQRQKSLPHLLGLALFHLEQITNKPKSTVFSRRSDHLFRQCAMITSMHLCRSSTAHTAPCDMQQGRGTNSSVWEAKQQINIQTLKVWQPQEGKVYQ